jgi:hypothetical protein
MSDNAMTADHAGTERLRRELETEAAGWADRGEAGGLLDRARLQELDGWLRVDGTGAGAIAISETAVSFVAASRAAAQRRWWPSQTTTGGALAILLILLILATPVTLLSIVGFTAALIHRVLN